MENRVTEGMVAAATAATIPSSTEATMFHHRRLADTVVRLTTAAVPIMVTGLMSLTTGGVITMAVGIPGTTRKDITG